VQNILSTRQSYTNWYIEERYRVKILRKVIQFCFKFEDSYFAETEFQVRWKQVVIILLRSDRKNVEIRHGTDTYTAADSRPVSWANEIAGTSKIRKTEQNLLFIVCNIDKNEQQRRNLRLYLKFWDCRKQCQNYKLGIDWKNRHCATKITEVIEDFYNSNLELHANYITWENLEEFFYINSGTWRMIIITLLNYKRHKPRWNSAGISS
jgi:hypothetical protein